MIDFETLNTTCAKCGKPANNFSVFPGNICFTCHEADFKMPSESDLTNSFKNIL